MKDTIEKQMFDGVILRKVPVMDSMIRLSDRGNCDFNDFEAKYIKNQGFVGGYYMYYYGYYEGGGEGIFVDADGNWVYHDLGHCSCYGPTDNIGKASLTFEQALEKSRFTEKQKKLIRKDWM